MSTTVDPEVPTAVEAAIARLEENDGIDLRPEPVEPRRIVVLSPKGGVGRTTVATNLAVLLAQRTDADVALADLSLQFGDVATSMLLDPRSGLARLTDEPRPFRTATVSAALTRHADGPYVLTAPEDPVAAESFSSDDVANVVDCLTAVHRYVVMDTPAGLDAATLSAVERATDLVLVAALDVPTLLALRQALDLLARLGTPARRHVVVNRCNVRAGVQLPDVESTLGLPVLATIPDARPLVAAMNEGRPIVTTEPRSPAAKALGRVADALLDDGARPKVTSRARRRGARS